MQEQYFYSNGKLLISGEYLVLKGAKALAVPVKFGQDLRISSKPSCKQQQHIEWHSCENGKTWFSMQASYADFSLIQSTDAEMANRLLLILKFARQQNPAFLSNVEHIQAKTNLSFRKNWGLGSSSTLLNNIASWAQIDAYKLLKNTFGGSGYDIACAQSNMSLFYQLDEDKPKVSTAAFDPPFKENLYFVYLGKKQDTRTSINYFQSLPTQNSTLADEISHISQQLATTKSLNTFNLLLRKHEEIIASMLQTKRIQEQYFSDFQGEIKSLGAWGGDFILASYEGGLSSLKSYFENKKLRVIFTFADLVRQM